MKLCQFTKGKPFNISIVGVAIRIIAKAMSMIELASMPIYAIEFIMIISPTLIRNWWKSLKLGKRKPVAPTIITTIERLPKSQAVHATMNEKNLPYACFAYSYEPPAFGNDATSSPKQAAM